MRPVFGTVVHGRVALNEAGRLAREMWLAVGHHHLEYVLDEFVVMPNHVHGQVHVTGGPDGPRTPGGPNGPPLRTSAGLPDFVRRFKSTSDVAWRKMFDGAGAGRRACPSPDTMRNGRLWQRNYWDVIVRDTQALANIRQYIRLNPQNDAVVVQGDETRHLGNRALLERSKLGFLASRGGTVLHGELPLKTGEAGIQAFQSSSGSKASLPW